MLTANLHRPPPCKEHKTMCVRHSFCCLSVLRRAPWDMEGNPFIPLDIRIFFLRLQGHSMPTVLQEYESFLPYIEYWGVTELWPSRILKWFSNVKVGGSTDAHNHTGELHQFLQTWYSRVPDSVSANLPHHFLLSVWPYENNPSK